MKKSSGSTGSYDTGTRENNGGGVDLARVALRRMKKGECATCGVKLYKQGGLLGKKLIPLTVPGNVLEGRCLICYPLDPAELELMKSQVVAVGAPRSRAEPPMEVPQELTVNDDATVVSAITVEHFPSRIHQDEMGSPVVYDDPRSDVIPPRPPMRPNASMGFANSMPLSSPRRSGRPGESEVILGSSVLQQVGLQRSQVEQSPSGPKGSSMSPSKAKRPSWQPDTISETHLYEGTVESTEFYFDGRSSSTRNPSNCTDNCSVDLDSFDSLPVHHRHADALYSPHLQQIHENSIALDHQETIIVESRYRESRVGGRQANFGTLGANSPNRTREESLYTVEDAETLLKQLESTSESERKVELLESLTECVWELGGPAKAVVISSHGVDILAMILWAEMSVLTTVHATASLLLALVAKGESPNEVHFFKSGGAADGLMDALLITMQTQVNDEQLQEIFCRIFCCLASKSGDYAEVNDGSLSGAVQSILKAMYVHTDSEGIQEWGTRALYNQCVYSRNAEPNKRTLACASLDTGFTGSVVLQRILNNFSATDPVVEWCCKLYWVLSASADLADMISPAIELMREMYRLLRELLGSGPASIPVLEAILGALSNFSVMEKNIDGKDETDTVFFLFDVIRSSGPDAGVVVESCNLVAAMTSAENVNRDVVVQDGGVRFLLDVMSTFEHDPVVAEAILTALVVLSQGSVATKSELCEPDSLSFILQVCGSRKEWLQCQELCAALFASILMAEALGQDHPEQSHIIDYLLFVTESYPDSKRLHDGCCNVIRNLSCYPEYEHLLATDDVLKLLIDDMCNFSDTGSIHDSACCALWNLKFDGLTGEHIQCILTTLQNHLDNKDVVHMGCGALWSIVAESEQLKKELVNAEGGVETVACVLMMHPDTDYLLETACGLLTSLTMTSELVEGVVSTQAFQNVIDAMRSEKVTVNLLESGALFLRNVCLGFPEFAAEAVSVIPSVIQGMTKHMDEANFQKAACSFLWLAATQSKEAKSKTLSLDGVALLMNIMEQHSGLEDVEEAALDAFRELTLSY